MILFPVLLNSLSSTLLEHTALNDVCRLYRETAWTKLSMYSTSVLRLPILEASKTALAMGFKVGVMAEILSSVRSGMGRGMQYAKLNLDTPTLFAYTVCIILISYLIQGCIQIYMHHISKRV